MSFLLSLGTMIVDGARFKVIRVYLHLFFFCYALGTIRLMSYVEVVLLGSTYQPWGYGLLMEEFILRIRKSDSMSQSCLTWIIRENRNR